MVSMMKTKADSKQSHQNFIESLQEISNLDESRPRNIAKNDVESIQLIKDREVFKAGLSQPKSFFISKHRGA